MHYYLLHGYDEYKTMKSDTYYTQEEFTRMCKEAPMYEYLDNKKCYDIDYIAQHLIDKYNFSYLDFTAGFFIAIESD